MFIINLNKFVQNEGLFINKNKTYKMCNGY